jgi:hypothetical protein
MLESSEETFYFTFGYGQEHPNKYVKLKGTLDSTRQVMHTMYGNRWSMQYSKAQWVNQCTGITLAEKRGWTPVGGVDSVARKESD